MEPGSSLPFFTRAGRPLWGGLGAYEPAQVVYGPGTPPPGLQTGPRSPATMSPSTPRRSQGPPLGTESWPGGPPPPGYPGMDPAYGSRYEHYPFGDDPKQPPPEPWWKRICCTTCCCQVCFLFVVVLLTALWVFYSYVMATCTWEIHGTEFTFWNYAVLAGKYQKAGWSDTVSLAQWYKDLTREDPLVGVGPGPNTRTYYGYSAVRGLLQGLAAHIRSGSMERANELGMQLLHGDMWPETGRIVFGLDNSDHGTVRKYLYEALDGAERPGADCDGSTCWNLAWLRRVFQQRLAGLSYFTRDDIAWMVAVLMHKVHLNIDLSDEEALQFVAFQTALRRVAPLPRNDLWEALEGAFPIALKRRYIRDYRAAISRKWPDEDWKDGPVKLVVLSSAMLDSLAIHSGPAASRTLEHALALLHMQGEPGYSLVRPIAASNVADIQDLVWETLRRYPPVDAVPFWVTTDRGQRWEHKIVSLHQALHDPSVFPNPLAVNPGREGLNHANSSLSIGFADFAMADSDAASKDSHSCPGKRLALAILQAFLQEFFAFQWKVDDANIHLSSFSTSGFTLRKVGKAILPQGGATGGLQFDTQQAA